MHPCKTKVIYGLSYTSLSGYMAELQPGLLLADCVGAESCVAGLWAQPSSGVPWYLSIGLQAGSFPIIITFLTNELMQSFH